MQMSNIFQEINPRNKISQNSGWKNFNISGGSYLQSALNWNLTLISLPLLVEASLDR